VAEFTLLPQERSIRPATRPQLTDPTWNANGRYSYQWVNESKYRGCGLSSSIRAAASSTSSRWPPDSFQRGKRQFPIGLLSNYAPDSFRFMRDRLQSPSYLVDTADLTCHHRSNRTRISYLWSSNPIGLTKWMGSLYRTKLYAAVNSTSRLASWSRPSIRIPITARERVLMRSYNQLIKESYWR